MIAGNHITAEKLKTYFVEAVAAKLNITLLRKRKQVTVTITRGAIPLYSLDAAYMITDTSWIYPAE